MSESLLNLLSVPACRHCRLHIQRHAGAICVNILTCSKRVWVNVLRHTLGAQRALSLSPNAAEVCAPTNRRMHATHARARVLLANEFLIEIDGVDTQYFTDVLRHNASASYGVCVFVPSTYSNYIRHRHRPVGRWSSQLPLQLAGHLLAQKRTSAHDCA